MPSFPVPVLQSRPTITTWCCETSLLAAQQQAALAVAKPIVLALLTLRLNDSSQTFAGFTFGAPVPGL